MTEAAQRVRSRLPFAVRGFQSQGDLLRFLYMVAASERRVLLVGETGTGKSSIAKLLARMDGKYTPTDFEPYLLAIPPLFSTTPQPARSKTERSPRKSMSFLEVDLSTVTGDMAKSELFGHVKGAFTGATYDRLGALRAVGTGVLFIDEVDSSSKEIQANLLGATRADHFLVRPLGSEKSYLVTPRVVAACCSLRRIREELAYRLGQVVLHLVPLRQRVDEIPTIAQDLLRAECRRVKVDPREFAPDAIQWLQDQTWPGNLRELQSLVANCVLVSAGSPEPIGRRELERVQAFTMVSGHPAAVSPSGAGSQRDKAPASVVARALRLSAGRVSRRELEALLYESVLASVPPAEQAIAMSVEERRWRAPEYHAQHLLTLDALGRRGRVRLACLGKTEAFLAKVAASEALGRADLMANAEDRDSDGADISTLAALSGRRGE